MTDEQTAAIEAARARLRLANPGRLSDDEAERLAPQLAELAAGLAALEAALALEEEPAVVMRHP